MGFCGLFELYADTKNEPPPLQFWEEVRLGVGMRKQCASTSIVYANEAKKSTKIEKMPSTG